jgi:hypothetical protein
VHQQHVARGDRELGQRSGGGLSRGHQRGGSREGQLRRLGDEIRSGRHHVRRLAVHHRRAEHRRARARAGDTLAEQVDHPRELLADLMREVPRPASQPALAHGDVEGLHAGCAYPDPYLARTRRRIAQFRDPQHLGRAVPVEHRCSHGPHSASWSPVEVNCADVRGTRIGGDGR